MNAITPTDAPRSKWAPWSLSELRALRTPDEAAYDAAVDARAHQVEHIARELVRNPNTPGRPRDLAIELWGQDPTDGSIPVGGWDNLRLGFLEHAERLGLAPLPPNPYPRDLEMLASEGCTDPDVLEWIDAQEAMIERQAAAAAREWRERLAEAKGRFLGRFPKATPEDFDSLLSASREDDPEWGEIELVRAIERNRVRPVNPEDGEDAAQPVEAKTGEAWPEPADLLAGGMTPKPVFTRDMFSPAVAEAAFDQSERIGVLPVTVGVNKLVTVASVMPRTLCIQPGRLNTGYTEPPILNAIQIAPPGTRKTEAQRVAVKPLEALHGAAYTDYQHRMARYERQHGDWKELQRGRGAKIREGQEWIAKDKQAAQYVADNPEPIKPKQRRYVVNDATVEKLGEILEDNNRGLLIAMDEFAELLGSFDAYRPNGGISKDRTAYLRLFEGGRHGVHRIGRGDTEVKFWGSCVLGNIQPDRLAELAPKLTQDGFLQRSLLIEGARRQAQDREPDTAAGAAYESVVRTLAALPNLEGEPAIILSEGAHKEHQRVVRVVEGMASLLETPAPLRDHLHKLAGICARIMLVMHAVEWAAGGPDPSWERPGGEVTSETAKRAADFMIRFYIPNVLRVYGAFFSPAKAQSDATRILKHILAHKRDRITRRIIRQSWWKGRQDEAAIGPAMATLTAAGCVRPAPGEMGQVEKWDVNPRVHVLFARQAEEAAAELATAQERIKAGRSALAAEYGPEPGEEA